MSYLPITYDLTDKQCLIVGAGQVAYRKLSRLLASSASVTVLAPDVLPEIEALAAENKIILIRDEFRPAHLQAKQLVIIATNDRTLNRQIAHQAKVLHCLVNVVDDPQHSNFISPAIIDRSPLQIAISTNGIAPMLARKIREKIEWILPGNLGGILSSLKKNQEAIRSRFSDFISKKSFLEWYLDKAINQDIDTAEPISTSIRHYENNKIPSKVYLLGSGPGDPDLLTIKALRVLQKADVVLHDSLVSSDILALIRRDAELISVGKRARKHSVQQAEIHQLLTKYARQNLTVVRLKGGDPFIFGRGGEELEHLVANGINFEVVPGITAASGCASYAGIPLTHRDYAQTVMFITAHCKQSNDTLDWASIAKHQQTVAVYMGLMRNETLVRKLIEHGRDAATPVAIIENGTREQQRVVNGRLDQLTEMVNTHNLGSPALIVIGEVVALATKLAWFKPEQHITHTLTEVAHAA